MASNVIPHILTIVSRSEARQRGLRRFFTGVPCVDGHISERYVGRGTCIACVKQKNARRWKNNKDGERQRQKEWIARNRERVRARKRISYLRNCERILAAARARYSKSPEIRRRQSREYAEKNKQLVIARVKAWASANPEKTREARKRWNIANGDRVRMIKAICDNNRKAAIGQFTSSDIRRILKDQKYKCAYCRQPLQTCYHIDHIVPISKGGTNWAANIQCTCASCNIHKNAKDPITFAQEIGKLL